MLRDPWYAELYDIMTEGEAKSPQLIIEESSDIMGKTKVGDMTRTREEQTDINDEDDLFSMEPCQRRREPSTQGVREEVAGKQMSKVHRRTKKRITYKNDKMVETIDLRGSDNMHSAAREEAEEEHDQSISKKFDGEEDEATSEEGGDSNTSDGHLRDTHEADDEDWRSSDGTAQDEGGDGADEDEREPERRGEGGAADAPPIDSQVVRHDNTVQKGKQNVL
ncbi:hypothetical protein CBR_g30830 [Chara braunii]|uniref:Uncharacterized protein n=1 Tax=Chara braunii TaxID=69332 RepID=A0A388JXP4_CHABU|nr:hypothetical protein CBR_g30830 [Chara braunii]|eukprot:GBG62512.1 hypothetical protein CBR_g30830 [Chara braunii]